MLQAHDGFLALVAPELTWHGELSPELPSEARQADLVWEVADATGERGILHIELQTRVDATIGERVLEYAVRLWRHYHLPVNSVVVYLRPAQTTPAPPFAFAFRGRERLRYDYDVLRLWELHPDQVLRTTQYPLWPLAVLMGQTTPKGAATIAEQIAQAPLDRHERSELTGLSVLLASIRVSHAQLVEQLRRTQMISELLEDSSFAEVIRELFLEKDAVRIRQEAEAEGRAEGRAEGEAEGEAKGLHMSVRMVLEARFGPLDEALSAAIEGLGIDALKTLLPICSTGTLDEVRARLAEA